MTANAITVGDIQVELSGEDLRLEVLDYHAGPVHISACRLADLGLESIANSTLPPSAVLERFAGIRRPCDAEPHGPAVLDPDWRASVGIQSGAFRLVPVREGLDIFVDGYDAAPATVRVALLGVAHVA